MLRWLTSNCIFIEWKKTYKIQPLPENYTILLFYWIATLQQIVAICNLEIALMPLGYFSLCTTSATLVYLYLQEWSNRCNGIIALIKTWNMFIFINKQHHTNYFFDITFFNFKIVPNYSNIVILAKKLQIL